MRLLSKRALVVGLVVATAAVAIPAAVVAQLTHEQWTQAWINAQNEAERACQNPSSSRYKVEFFGTQHAYVIVDDADDEVLLDPAFKGATSATSVTFDCLWFNEVETQCSSGDPVRINGQDFCRVGDAYLSQEQPTVVGYPDQVYRSIRSDSGRRALEGGLFDSNQIIEPADIDPIGWIYIVDDDGDATNPPPRTPRLPNTQQLSNYEFVPNSDGSTDDLYSIVDGGWLRRKDGRCYFHALDGSLANLGDC